jgi:hypothetical protein
VELFRAFERLGGMWRSVLLAVVLAGVLAGCSLGGGSGAGSGGQTTRLTFTVAEGNSVQHRYNVVCPPTAVQASTVPAGVCAALEDYLPRRIHSRPSCLCKDYAYAVRVTGVFDGVRIRRPVEVSGCAACGLGNQAQSDVQTVFDGYEVPAQ